jgi:tetratricopeptide (TPR) repeat protein
MRHVRQIVRSVQLSEWKPDPDAACPCGSGNTYSSCCEQLRGKVNWKQAADAWADGKLAQAEALFRGLLVQYLGWVHEHTLPARGTSVYTSLEAIDAAAIRDIADSIAACMAKQGKLPQLIPFLDALETAVPLESFASHAVYLRSLSYHVYLDDANRSRQEFHKLPHVAHSTDSEVLELYLDVFRDSLSELEQLPLVDRILLKPRTRAVELQYTMLRSFLYVALGDAAAALRALEPVVEKLTGDRPQPPRWDEVHMAARLYDHRYQVGGNRADYEEAVSYYKQVPMEILTPHGQAGLLRELGALQSKAEEHGEAVSCLRKALATDPSDEISVSLVFALIASKRTDDAVAVFATIDRDRIPAVLQLEYWHAAGTLAVATGNGPQLDAAVAALRAIAFSGVYWARVRDHVIEELSKDDGRSSRIARLLRLANRYFELKPNIFGLGVDLNSVLERVADALDNR